MIDIGGIIQWVTDSEWKNLAGCAILCYYEIICFEVTAQVGELGNYETLRLSKGK